jgi:5'-nucleotidase
MNSIEQQDLNMVRAAFCGGANPYTYAHAFGASLFLSANSADVRDALKSGIPAAAIMTSGAETTHEEIRLALDGDAVLFSDKSEILYQQQGLAAFNESERQQASSPMEGGPLKPFLEVIHKLQRKFEGQPCPVRTALVTARAAPAHERVIRTLRSWDVRLDEMMFLGGMDKADFVKAFQADIYFDDQMRHVASVGSHVASAHVPAGIMNVTAAS